MTVREDCKLLGLHLIHARESVLAGWDVLDQMKRAEDVKLTPSAESFLKEAQESYQDPAAKLTSEEVKQLDDFVKSATLEMKRARYTEATYRFAALRDRVTDFLFQKVVACECKKE